MERRWRYYRKRRIRKEFDALPDRDRRALILAMVAYAEGREAGFRHSDYGDGLEMLTDGGRGQGRCLYFTRDSDGATETLVILLAYKKETEKAPTATLQTARNRRETYLAEPDEDHDDDDAEEFHPEPE